MCRGLNILPHQWCWLVLLENEVAFWRDVDAQEVVDGAGDGVAEDGGVADAQLEVLFCVEEGRLDEDGCASQHGEVGIDLDAAVQRLLHDGRERVAPR